MPCAQADRIRRRARLHRLHGCKDRAFTRRGAAAALHSLTHVVDDLDVEATAAEALRQGAWCGGVREYAAQQRLMARHEALGWVDATVVEAFADGAHWLFVAGWGSETLTLHPWNHAPLELPLDSFEAYRRFHLRALTHRFGTTVDPLLGAARRWDVLDECPSCGLEQLRERADGDLSEDEMYVIGTVSSQICCGLHADVVAWQHLHPDGSWTREKTRNARSMFDENK